MTSPVTHEAQVSGVNGVPLPISETELLLQDLQELAYNNPLFRKGRRDYVDFEVGEGDIIEDPDNPVDRINFSYGFKAERQRVGENGPFTLYEFKVVGRYADSEMPAHLAARLTEKPPHEAVQDVGRVTLEQGLKYTIATDEKDLHICHSITYFGDEDDELFSICSCPSDHEGLFYGHAEQPTDGSVATIAVPSQQQSLMFLERRARREVIKVDKIETEEDIAVWAEFAKAAGHMFDIYEKAEEDAEQAREFLRTIRRALLVQAGVQINKYTLPPLKH